MTIVCRLAFAIVAGLAGGVPGFTRAQTGPATSRSQTSIIGVRLPSNTHCDRGHRDTAGRCHNRKWADAAKI